MNRYEYYHTIIRFKINLVPAAKTRFRTRSGNSLKTTIPIHLKFWIVMYTDAQRKYFTKIAFLNVETVLCWMNKFIHFMVVEENFFILFNMVIL